MCENIYTSYMNQTFALKSKQAVCIPIQSSQKHVLFLLPATRNPSVHTLIAPVDATNDYAVKLHICFHHSSIKKSRKTMMILNVSAYHMLELIALELM